MPYLCDVATVFPRHNYKQQEIFEGIKKYYEKYISNMKRIESIFNNTKVESRHLALEIEEYLIPRGFEEKNNLWKKNAIELGEKVVSKLLNKMNISPEEINLFSFNSVTGISVPSVDAFLINKMNFSPKVKRVPLFGLGCLSGVAGLHQSIDYLVGHPKENALFLSTEFCSLTLQLQDISVANIISAALFADGVAAVLLCGDESPLVSKSKMKFKAHDQLFFKDTNGVMGWDIIDSGFKIVLTDEVPTVAKDRVSPFIRDFLKNEQVPQSDIGAYLIHPGGPKILTAFEEALELQEKDLRYTLANLAKNGNMSSVSILSIMEDFLLSEKNDSSHTLMTAMGPGFSAQVSLWERL